MKLVAPTVLIFGMLLMLGCGGASFKSEAVTAPPPPAPTAKAKAILEDVARSGELGSGTMELRDTLEQIKQSDATKGDALLSDYKKLESAKSPTEIKTQASSMLQKL